MKKIFSILSLAVLTACGGGGDSTPAAPVVPKYDYAAHNGNYICVYENVPFTIKATFEETMAVMEVTIPTVGTYTIVYNDYVWKLNEHPVYTEYLKDGIDVESIVTIDTRSFAIAVGPKVDLTKYYVGRLVPCTK